MHQAQNKPNIKLRVAHLKTRNQGGTVVITIPKKSGVVANECFDFVQYTDGSLRYYPVSSTNYWQQMEQTTAEAEIAQMHRQIASYLKHC